MSEHIEAFDMSPNYRIISTNGRIRGEFAVHGIDDRVFAIYLVEATVYDEDRSWGRIFYSTDLDVVVDLDTEQPTLRAVNDRKPLEEDEARLFTEVLRHVIRAWHGGVGSVVAADFEPLPSGVSEGEPKG